MIYHLLLLIIIIAVLVSFIVFPVLSVTQSATPTATPSQINNNESPALYIGIGVSLGALVIFVTLMLLLILIIIRKKMVRRKILENDFYSKQIGSSYNQYLTNIPQSSIVLSSKSFTKLDAHRSTKINSDSKN